nr:hypothetical protein [Odonatan tombus-related virus]
MSSGSWRRRDLPVTRCDTVWIDLILGHYLQFTDCVNSISRPHISMDRPLVPYGGLGPAFAPYIPALTNAAGQLVRNAWRYYANERPLPQRPPRVPRRRQAQQPPQQPTVAVTQPRRRRRARGTGAPPRGQMTRPMPTTGAGGSTIIVRDTEMFAPGKKTVFTTVTFNPGNDTATPRLNAEAKKFQRFRIRYFNIAYVSASSAASTGSMTFGVAPGPAITTVKAATDIMKLRPAQVIPVWRAATINQGANIDSSRFMFSQNATVDGVAFTLYSCHTSTEDVPGYFKASYEVELAYPIP